MQGLRFSPKPTEKCVHPVMEMCCVFGVVLKTGQMRISKVITKEGWGMRHTSRLVVLLDTNHAADREGAIEGDRQQVGHAPLLVIHGDIFKNVCDIPVVIFRLRRSQH